MRGRPVGPWLLIGLAAAASACTASTEPSPSPSSTAIVQPLSASAPAAADGLACPAIALVGPNGAEVDLTGEWGGGEWFQTPGSGERTFVLQRGSCIWASITDAEFRTNPQPEASQLALYYGTLSEDFAIDGTMVVMMRWNDPFTYGTQAPGPSPMRLRIEFDAAGEPLLAEDRQPGVQGPRCPNPTMWCPAPTVLQRLVAGPSPAGTAP